MASPRRLRTPLRLCLAATWLILAGCSDHDVATRTPAAPGSIPADDEAAFDRIGPLLPVTRASWIGMIEDVDLREWPATMYVDYRRHLETKKRLGARAPAWPSARYDRLRLEEFREPLDTQVVVIDGRVLFLIAQSALRYTAARADKAGGIFHNLSVLDVDTGRETLIGQHLEGIRLGEPLVFEAAAFQGQLVVLAATMDGVVQVIGEPGPEGMTYGEPTVIASHTKPVTDLQMAVTDTHVHAAWTRGTLDTEVRTVAWASARNPQKLWSRPTTLAGSARAGTLALCASGRAVHVAWGDTRFSKADQVPPSAWAMVASSADHGVTFGRPLLVGDAGDPDDSVGRLVAVPWGDAVILYWSAHVGASWPATWRKNVLDAETGSVAVGGEIDGADLLAAYQQHMTAALTKLGAARYVHVE